MERDPENPVALLTRGNKRATVFLLTDQAFSRLVAIEVAFDINKANKQVGHTVDRVLRPASLR